MLAQYKKQAFYISSEDGLNVEKYDSNKLYNKLKLMDEVSRYNLIREINAQYGHEAVNYKLLQQIYEQEYIKSQENIVKKEESAFLDNFAKDYQKAYMKMLSV